jgi:hypothetical protein
LGSAFQGRPPPRPVLARPARCERPGAALDATAEQWCRRLAHQAEEEALLLKVT